MGWGEASANSASPPSLSLTPSSLLPLPSSLERAQNTPPLGPGVLECDNGRNIKQGLKMRSEFLSSQTGFLAGAEQRRGLGGWATRSLAGWEKDFLGVPFPTQ